jgi:hypothetical protein
MRGPPLPHCPLSRGFGYAQLGSAKKSSFQGSVAPVSMHALGWLSSSSDSDVKEMQVL